MDEQLRYSMLIAWSEEDQAYIVSFLEWEADGLIGHAHGATHEEALRHGQEVLHMLVESARREGERLPTPRAYSPGGSAAVAPVQVHA